MTQKVKEIIRIVNRSTDVGVSGSRFFSRSLSWSEKTASSHAYNSSLIDTNKLKMRAIGLLVGIVCVCQSICLPLHILFDF